MIDWFDNFYAITAIFSIFQQNPHNTACVDNLSLTTSNQIKYTNVNLYLILNVILFHSVKYLYLHCCFISEWVPFKFWLLLYPLSWCWMDLKRKVFFFNFCLIYGLLCDCKTSKSHYFPKREAREEYPVYKGCNLFVWFWWTHPVIFRLILMEASHVFLIVLACFIFPFLVAKNALICSSKLTCCLCLEHPQMESILQRIEIVTKWEVALWPLTQKRSANVSCTRVW